MSLTLISDPPALRGDEVLAVGCMRNATLRLPDFLAHHRQLGVDRFLLVDNDSDDGTRDLLLEEPDVHLFYTQESYSTSNCGISWLNWILAAHADNHWCLILDEDELFVFPGWESIQVRPLTVWLDTIGAQAVKAPLLDMYPAVPLTKLGYRAGDSLVDACTFFDASDYVRDPEGDLLRGGPRHRLFWEGRNRSYPSPLLRKFPLVRWRSGLALEASTHLIRGTRVAPLTGLLLHFKFLQDFLPNAVQEAARGEHFAGARQYAAYADRPSADATFSAFSDVSVRLRDSTQLVKLGFMRIPVGYPFMIAEGKSS